LFKGTRNPYSVVGTLRNLERVANQRTEPETGSR